MAGLKACAAHVTHEAGLKACATCATLMAMFAVASAAAVAQPPSTLVLSCVEGRALRTGFRAASSQIRVEAPEGGEVDPLNTPAGVKAIVFLFTSTDCPISNRYAPDVRRLVMRFAPQGVLFKLVYPNPADDRRAILEHMGAFAYAGATQALRDPKHALVKFTGVTVTPEAAIYAGSRVVYHGRIDDRYVDLGLERPAARVHDLADALTAVVAGQPVKQPVAQAVGCYIADFR